MRERHKAEELLRLFKAEAARARNNSIAGAITTTIGAVSGLGGPGIAIGGQVLSAAGGALWDWGSNYACQDTDMEKIMKKTRMKRRIKPILDPSGVVYEAVETNRLEGVTATVWFAEDAQGTNAQPWDAEAYEQENP